MMLNLYILFSEVSDVLNDEQMTIAISGPTPKEAFETFKKSGNPSSPRKKSELPVQKCVESFPEDNIKKISYASVVSIYFRFSILATLLFKLLFY